MGGFAHDVGALRPYHLDCRRAAPCPRAAPSGKGWGHAQFVRCGRGPATTDVAAAPQGEAPAIGAPEWPATRTRLSRPSRAAELGPSPVCAARLSRTAERYPSTTPRARGRPHHGVAGRPPDGRGLHRYGRRRAVNVRPRKDCDCGCDQACQQDPAQPVATWARPARATELHEVGGFERLAVAAAGG
jgi:hypothetical protein